MIKKSRNKAAFFNALSKKRCLSGKHRPGFHRIYGYCKRINSHYLLEDLYWARFDAGEKSPALLLIELHSHHL